MSSSLPSVAASVTSDSERVLARSEFHRLAQVPPETEWFANIDNERTRRAYRGDIREFMRLVGI